MKNFLILLVALFLVSIPVKSATHNGAIEQLVSTMQTLVDEGKIVGAQIAVSHHDKVLLSSVFGARSIADQTGVDSETLFCIGSCSKPVASAVVMSLVDDGTLALDKPVEAWLPSFGSPKLIDGKSVLSPTMAELLSHHGGIYSQKMGMTKRQTRWIRDFRLRLEAAVEGIAREPLIAKPGEKYAYSGAGYCVVGRVAEVAAGTPFEELLQSRICEPLNLYRTTYFPSPKDINVASGSLAGEINTSTPHLYRPFQLPLIGGSLYSTAEESLRFLQTILNQISSGEEVLMSNELLRPYTTPYSERRNYAFGWSVIMENGAKVGLKHSGALASSRAIYQINTQDGICVAILYTLSDPGQSGNISRQFGAVLESLL